MIIFLNYFKKILEGEIFDVLKNMKNKKKFFGCCNVLLSCLNVFEMI